MVHVPLTNQHNADVHCLANHKQKPDWKEIDLGNFQRLESTASFGLNWSKFVILFYNYHAGSYNKLTTANL